MPRAARPHASDAGTASAAGTSGAASAAGSSGAAFSSAAALSASPFASLCESAMTMTVMSSTTPSSSTIHRWCAVSTSLFTASSGVLHAAVIATASSDVTNSHSPSLAITTNLSLGSSSYLLTSGSVLTPTRCASMSPNARLIARPGIHAYLSHTLCGPTFVPCSSTSLSTRPPIDKIRFFSSSVSGLWSTDRSTVCITPPRSRASTARLSPTQAHHSVERCR
mmetsp:Transcript_10958/g.38014  ORF Transcript_10958/g.38014 Transcript_10958/m.38014 type:complete len:223 (+) Transcript_10958:758-1426(+)